MQELLRWLAAWKGITVENGAELHFEFSSFPTGGLALLVLLGLGALLAFVVFIYRRDGKHLSRGQRFVLGTLRLLAVLAAASLLLEPNIVAIKRDTRPGHALLLLDTSQSMSHLDAYRRDSSQVLAQGWRDLGVSDPAAVPRMELAKALLRYRAGELVQKLAARNAAQLYGFAAGIDGLPTVAAPPGAGDPPPAPQLDVARIEANGRFSNLGGAVRASMDKSRNAEIAAIVILSDGRRNTGPQGAEVARLLNQRKVPHTFVLGIGDPAETQSVEVTRIEAPEKVFQKDPFELRANIAAQGYEPTSIDVKLVRIDDKGTEQVMRTLPLAIGGDKSTAVAEFKELSSDTTGRFTWRVELQPPSGEPPSPERHKKNVAIDVLGEKTRVLLLAGGASHEFQILRNLLIRDKTIDVSCWLQSADANFPQDGDVDVRIDKLPADRPQLDVYDAVVLMDPNPAQLTAPFCELLRKHVLEDGCGLWWVCGEKFTLDAVRPAAITRPIAELLPVVPDIERAERLIIGFGLAFPRAWPYALTPEGDDGLGAKITRIAENRDESRLLWGRLPGFHFAFPVQRPKPAATVLAEHTNPELKKDGHPMPLLVTQFVGAGRVLFSGTDETYRWRSLYEDAYNRYWVKGIRYLYEGRINAGNSRLRLLVGDEKVELGEAVKLTAEARNEVFQPLVVESIELSLEHEGHPAEVLKLLPLQQVPGSYELQYRPTATGFYRARATQAQGKEVDIGFQVVSAQIEREGPMDRAELAAMAAANGGQLLDTPSQLLAALDQIQSRSATDTFRTPHPMWDGWSTVVFMLTALGLEWLLRKRFNLL